MEDRIEKTIEIAAPVSRVWRALTDHEQFGTWFKVRLDGPFAVGEISTGEVTYPGFEGHPWQAIVRRMEPETLFAFEWPHDGNIDIGDQPTTLVEFRLQPVDAGTRLTITESGFMGLPEDKRLQAFRSNSEGWDIQSENIRAYAEG